MRIIDFKTSTFYKNIFNYDYNFNEYNLNDDTLLILSTPYYSKVLDNNYFEYFPTYSSKSIATRYGIDTFVWDELINMIADSVLTDIFQINRIIQSAKSEINLQFLSYNPVTKEGYWEEVDTALISASKRGVKVKLLVSDWNLSKTAVEHFKELIQFPNFEIRYTSIPEYSGGFISYARVEHCKFITADSTCWIGTSNMSYDYFYESRNVGVVIDNGKFTQRVRDIFYKSWDSEYANPVEPNGEYLPRKRDHD
ncbi:MAG: Cardiolipin synthase [Chlorobi bacterium OLB5]|nr:MAG: Cardiolipin synthase [Chlorobi bacterium OLB5]